MAIKWYAIQTSLPSKEKIKAAVIEHGFEKELKKIKNILTFDYEVSALWVEPGNSLLNGYALLQFNNKYMEGMMSMLSKSGIGHFLNTTQKNKTPKSVPEDQVKEFKKRVKGKKKEYEIGDEVVISEGLFSGLGGVIRHKKRLMAKVEIRLPNRTSTRWVSILSLKLLQE